MVTIEPPYVRFLKQNLWYLLVGTRGGTIRIKILNMLRERPYNANQLSKDLELDYKTIEHHLRVLKKENIINTNEEKKYGNLYFLSPFLEKNIDILDEIKEKIGKNNLKRRRKM